MPKTSLLPVAGPLTGDETVPIVQGGVTKQAPLGGLVDEITEDAQAYAEAAGTAMLNAPKQAAGLGERIGVDQTIDNIGDATGSTGNAAAGRAYGTRQRIARAGPLPDVTVKVASVGTGRIFVVADDGAGGGVVKAEYAVDVETTTKTFQIGVDFPVDAWGDVGDGVYFAPVTCGQVGFKAGTAGRYFSLSDYSGDVGDAVPLTDYAGTAAIAFSIRRASNNFAKRINERVPRRPLMARATGYREYDYSRWFDRSGIAAVEDLSGSADHLYAVAGAPAGITPRTDFCREGMRTRSQAWATVGSVSLQSHAVLLRVPEGQSFRALQMGGAKPLIFCDAQLRAAAIYHFGLDGVFPMLANPAGDNFSIVPVGDGYLLVFCQSDALDVGQLGIGGPPTGTANRGSDVTFVWSIHEPVVWDDARRLEIYDAVRIPMAQNRAVYLDERDCPERVDLVIALGQSQPEGMAPYTEMSATYANPGAQGDTHILIAENIGQLSSDWQPLVMRENNKYLGAESTIRFGVEFPYSRWHRSRRVRTGAAGQGVGGNPASAYRTRRPLWIMKLAAGGRFTVPVGNYVKADAAAVPVTAPLTFNAGVQRGTSGLFPQVQDAIIVARKRAFRRGIGLKLQMKHYSIGGQDGTLVDGAPLYEAAIYGIDAGINAVWGPSAQQAKKVITKTGTHDNPALNNDASVTQIGIIRPAQVSVVATWNGESPGSAAIVSADAYIFTTDGKHFGGQDGGMMRFGFEAMDAAAALGAFT